MESKWYDGTKLLSLMDIDGKRPEIYLCSTNRSAGKTTYFNRWLIKRFKSDGEKFVLLYRNNYELSDAAEKFFKDIRVLFYPNDVMESKLKAKGTYAELYLNGKTCGYAIALNDVDKIKRRSHFFNDATRMLFDEFQSETNAYLPDEISKFQSVHVSLARGNGKASRYLPVYMLGNKVSLLNPYYHALGIGSRLNSSTKFLRGQGWVLESGFNAAAAAAQADSAFNRAFASANYTATLTEDIYLKDTATFIEKVDGPFKYLCTIKYNDEIYSIRSYSQRGIVYCTDTADLQNKNRFALTTNDHDINFVLLNAASPFIIMLRRYFTNGAFRFKNIACKNVILELLSYR